jgi:hypothetical protein
MMLLTFHVQTKVLPGHRIEIVSPELPEGRSARVFVVLEEPEAAKRPLYEVIGNYPGGEVFASPQEVDAYVRAERESWDS